MIPTFKQWLVELDAGPGSGMTPPKQDPTKVSKVNAFTTVYGPGSDELPPTPERKEILKCKKKMKRAK
jgi:hypothetical protein